MRCRAPGLVFRFRSRHCQRSGEAQRLANFVLRGKLFRIAGKVTAMVRRVKSRAVSRGTSARVSGLRDALRIVRQRENTALVAAGQRKLETPANERTQHWENVERQCAMELSLVARAIEKLIARFEERTATESGSSPNDDEPLNSAANTEPRAVTRVRPADMRLEIAEAN